MLHDPILPAKIRQNLDPTRPAGPSDPWTTLPQLPSFEFFISKPMPHVIHTDHQSIHFSEISCHSLASSSLTPGISKFQFVSKACMLHSGTCAKAVLLTFWRNKGPGKIWSPRGLSDPSYVRHWFNHSYFKLLCCILLLHEQLCSPRLRPWTEPGSTPLKILSTY